MAMPLQAPAPDPGTESPLIQALPPACDYLTYLTIIEYNLTLDSLPILHSVLQDETLATNIGWDLVHLLLPLLPDSEPCLRDVAHRGNPREVILKVSESLRLVQYDDGDEHVGENADENVEGTSSSARVRADSSTFPLKTASTTSGDARPGSSQAIEIPPPPPLAVNQFCALLLMLTILHPRIKTKHPSRFLSTSLQAVLASFSNSSTHREDLIVAVVNFVRTLSGIKQSSLPDLRWSSIRSSQIATLSTAASAGDPEAAGAVETAVETAAEEVKLHQKLFQSFVTHILEEYMLNLSNDAAPDDVPGMAWSSQIVEKTQPRRTIPGRQTFADRFANEEKLRIRSTVVGLLVDLAQDLELTDAELLSAANATENLASQDNGDSEDDPPESANDIPLSRLGSLMLYTARSVSTVLADTAPGPSKSPIAIFPDHESVLKRCISSPTYGAGSVGTEPETLIDTVIAFGLVCLHNNSIGEAQASERLNEYLQIIALISSNCPSPVLRGLAHSLTTAILQAQPDEFARLGFIRDTLEHCPFENLKVSAVGWIKDETVKAMNYSSNPTANNKPVSIYASPLPIASLSPFLVPESLQADLITSPLAVGYLTFRTNLSFYLATLNFLYLLLRLPREKQHLLEIPRWWTDAKIQSRFLLPLRAAADAYRGALMEDGGELRDENSSDATSELIMVEEVLGRVEEAETGLIDG